jgi:AcrR family transcriptional regulator
MPDARPLRRDAERNRQRIMQAATEVFNERGLEVSLDEIARHAGVGVGTVYRRFRTKEELVEALFTERIEAVATAAEEGLAEPDAWAGLAGFMEQMSALLAGDAGLRQILMFATHGQDGVAYARQRNAPLVQRLLDRAQQAGQVRSDLRVTDIPLLVFMLAEMSQLVRAAAPEIWRRYLTLVLDGMRPYRDGVTPLPVPALAPDEMEKSMRQAAPRHR